MNILLEEYKRLLLLLLKHKVEFILVGGYAVIYYGYARTTGDMDIWLKPDNENKKHFILALRDFGILEDDLNKLQEIDFENAQHFFIGKTPNKIDFMTKLDGVTFSEADRSKNCFPLADQTVPIIQYEHLITNKIMSDRSKDKADVEELKNIMKYKRND